jgi:Domain of unknown function (DUF222)
MSTGWGTVADHPALAAVAEIGGAAARLSEANLWSLRPEELLGLRTELAEVQAQIDAATLAVDHEIEISGAAVQAGATSAMAWLRGSCRVEPRDAKREIALADALAGPLALTRDALAAGHLSVRHAHVIRDTLRALPPRTSAAVRADGQTWLVEQAKVFDPQQLARLGRHLRHVVDPDRADGGQAGLEAEEVDLHRARRFTLTHRDDGARIPQGLLDPETGALLQAALDALSAPCPSADSTPDPRTPAQRRADGLAEIVRLALGAPEMPTDGGEPVTLVVTVPMATLEGRLRDTTAAAGDSLNREIGGMHHPATAAELEDGTPISAEAARRLACDAYIVAAVLGSGSEVLDLGRRTRQPSRALRRALVIRDRGCAFPGCGRPPRWCHAHHIRHWSCGGDTSLCNLVLLCGRHHRVIHHEGWSVRIGPDGQPVFRPPRWIDPDRTERPSCTTTRQQALDHIPLRT